MNKESFKTKSHESKCMLSVMDIHKRMGHILIDKVKHINGIKYNGKGKLQCEVCPLSKQTKLPFPISHTAKLKSLN